MKIIKYVDSQQTLFTQANDTKTKGPGFAMSGKLINIEIGNNILNPNDSDQTTWLNGIDEKAIFGFIESLNLDLKKIDFRKETYQWDYFIENVPKIARAFNLSFPQTSYYLTNFICIKSGWTYK